MITALVLNDVCWIAPPLALAHSHQDSVPSHTFLCTLFACLVQPIYSPDVLVLFLYRVTTLGDFVSIHTASTYPVANRFPTRVTSRSPLALSSQLGTSDKHKAYTH